MRGLAPVLLIGLLGCSEAPATPFCGLWRGLGAADRDDVVREHVERYSRKLQQSRAPHLVFSACVTNFVVARTAAITAACENFGDLEAGVKLGQLFSLGAGVCAEVQQWPVQ